MPSERDSGLSRASWGILQTLKKDSEVDFQFSILQAAGRNDQTKVTFLLKAMSTQQKLRLLFRFRRLLLTIKRAISLSSIEGDSLELCTEFMLTVSLLKQMRVSENMFRVFILKSLDVTKTQ